MTEITTKLDDELAEDLREEGRCLEETAHRAIRLYAAMENADEFLREGEEEGWA